MATVSTAPRTTSISLETATAGPFDVGFRVFDDDKLTVYVNGVLREDWGFVDLTFADGYTDDAQIEFTDDLEDGDEITIDSDLSPRRDQDFINGDPRLTAKLNVELARLWSAVSDVKRDARRAARSFSDNAPLFPDPSADRVVMYDTAGQSYLGPALAEFDVIPIQGGYTFETWEQASAASILPSITIIQVRGCFYEEWTGASNLSLETTNGGTRMWAPFRNHITPEHFRLGTAVIDQHAVERAVRWAATVAATEPWYSTPDRIHGTPMVLQGGGGRIYDLFREVALTTSLAGNPPVDCAGLTIRDLAINCLDVAPSGQTLGWIDSDPWTGWTFRATEDMTAEEVEAAARHCFYRPRRRSFVFNMSANASRIVIDNARMNLNNMCGGVHLSARSHLINSKIIRCAGWGAMNKGGDAWVRGCEISQWQIGQDPEYYDPAAYTGCGIYGAETDLRMVDNTIFWLRELVRIEGTNNRSEGSHWFNGSQGYLAETREDEETGAATTEEFREAVFDYFKGIEDPQADDWEDADDVLTHDFTPRTYNPWLVMATPMTLEEYEEAESTDTPVKGGKQRLMDFRVDNLYPDNGHFEIFGGTLIVDRLDTGLKASSSLNTECPYVFGLYGHKNSGRPKIVIRSVTPMVETADVAETGFPRHMVALLTGPFGETNLTGGTTDDIVEWNGDWSVNTHRTRGNSMAGMNFSFMAPHTYVSAHWGSDVDPLFRTYSGGQTSRGIGFADRLTSRVGDGDDDTPLWLWTGSSGDRMWWGQLGAPAGPAMQLDMPTGALKLQPQEATPDVPNSQWIAMSDGTADEDGFGDEGAGLYEKVSGDWWKLLNAASEVPDAKVAMTGGGKLSEWRGKASYADAVTFADGKTPAVGTKLHYPDATLRYMGTGYSGGMPAAAISNWVPDGPVSIRHFGADVASGGDDTAAFNDAVEWSLAQTFHRTIHCPAGRYRLSDTLRIGPELQGSTETIEAVIFQGEGSRNARGTDIRFDFDDNTKNGLEVISGHMIAFRDLMISGDGGRKALVLVSADPSPAFSGHNIEFKNCVFRNFGAACEDAVVWAKNTKSFVLEQSYLGVQDLGETVLRLGGAEADDETSYHNGVVDNVRVRNNMLFGMVKYSHVKGMDFVGNTFTDDGQGGIAPIGDGRITCGRIAQNFFVAQWADIATNTTPGVVARSTDVIGGRAGGGGLEICQNTFRARLVGIDVDGVGPVEIWGNTFELVNSSSVGIKIAATAENVRIGANDDRLLKAAGAKVIDDLRQVFGTDQPTTGVSKSIVADAVLGTDDSAISANNSWQTVLTSAAVKLRGGLYRIRYHVPVRNTTASADLPFQARMQISRAGGAGKTNLGLIAAGTSPAVDKVEVSSQANGTIFTERIVYLPPDVVSGSASTVFELDVRNISASGAGTGFVDGAASELSTSSAAWFQVEEWHG